jgi:hypothetical protein
MVSFTTSLVGRRHPLIMLVAIVKTESDSVHRHAHGHDMVTARVTPDHSGLAG